MRAEISRRADTAHRDPALDGIRAVAVLLVFLFHFGGGLSSHNPLLHLFGIVTEAGWIGVVIFYTLSGFLITGGIWDSLNPPGASPRPHHVVRNFYARRALRILPIYYGILVLVTVLSLVRGSTLIGLRHLGLFFLFLQDVPWIAAQALNNPSPLPLYHLWSVAVEEQFYVVWPLFLLFASSRAADRRLSAGIKVCFGVVLFGFLFNVAIFGFLPQLTGGHRFDNFVLTHAGSLGLGSALALLLRSPSLTTQTRIVRWAGLGLLCGFGTYLTSSYLCHTFYLTLPTQFIVGLPGMALTAASLIVIAMRPGPVRFVLASPPFREIGHISYGFYIFQLLFQPVYRHYTMAITHTNIGPLYFGVRFFVALAISLGMAWLSFNLLELPFLRWKRHFPMRQPLPPIQAATLVAEPIAPSLSPVP
jgi:peptidoglycan/LPS O-acetylase OafA/YrhL